MGNRFNDNRTRAIVDVDDLIIRADNIVVVGDRDRDRLGQIPNRVAELEGFNDDDNDFNDCYGFGYSGDSGDFDDFDDVEIQRCNYYQDNVVGISEEVHYYGSKRIDN